MNWLEIIELRTSENNSETVVRELSQLINDINQLGKQTDVKLYFKTYLKTDLSIHIKHNKGPINQKGSDLGLQIASNLKTYGLVNHNFWVEAVIK